MKGLNHLFQRFVNSTSVVTYAFWSASGFSYLVSINLLSFIRKEELGILNSKKAQKTAFYLICFVILHTVLSVCRVFMETYSISV
jgi:hypothetical protein